MPSASSESVSSSASVAPGMKAPGGRMPNCGWRQRANASTPASCFLRRSILGWYQNSIQPFAERFVEPDARRLRRGVAELELLHDRDDGGGLERLLEHRQHLQPVLLADALDVLEHRGAAVAHQLHESEIAALAERDDGFDRLGGFQADVEEDEVRRAPLQRLAGSSRRRRIPRCRRRRHAGSATGNGGCSASSSTTKQTGTDAGGPRRRRRAVAVAGG